MRRGNNDFSRPAEEYRNPAPEYSGITLAPGYDGVTSAPEYDGVSLGGAPSATASGRESGRNRSTTHEMLKKAFLAPVIGAVAVLSVFSAAFGTDIFGDIFGDVVGSLGNIFPILPNLEPNGYVEAWDYGVMDEEFVRFEGEKGIEYLWAGKAYGTSPDAVDGASYDREKNVLTLNGFDGGDRVLNANLMGNGFTLRLEGENRLGGILMWGFYYGGSLTITGDGCLYVNSDGVREIGLQFNAEFSESCLMVDKSVGFIDAGGSLAAFMVYDSTHRRGLYAMSPLRLEGGKAGEIVSEKSEEWHDDPSMEFMKNGHIYTVFDGEEPSKHILISGHEGQ